jgi:hypothetical protein
MKFLVKTTTNRDGITTVDAVDLLSQPSVKEYIRKMEGISQPTPMELISVAADRMVYAGISRLGPEEMLDICEYTPWGREHTQVNMTEFERIMDLVHEKAKTAPLMLQDYRR